MAKRNVRCRRRALASGVASGVLVLAVGAHAQSGPSGAPQPTTPASTVEPGAVSEVIVTAEKRTQRLVDVPAAVSVVSGDDLARSAVKDISQLNELIPSINFTQGAGEDGSSVKIRGVGTQVFSIGVEPSVSYVVDGVVLAREAQALGDFFDIDRIEVLRGPQSTLFGKNASAGVINIVTKGPTRELHESASITLGEDGDREYRAAVSGPISPTLGFRVSAYDDHYDGFIHNAFNGKDINGSDSKGGRVKLVWDATDRLKLTGNFDYSKSEGTCCQYTFRTLVNPSTPVFISPEVAGPENRTANVNANVYNRTEQFGTSLTAEYALDKVVLTSITSYRRFFEANNSDGDGTPLLAPTVGQNANYILLDVNAGKAESDTITQEFRIANVGHQKLDYVAGVFVFDTDQHRPFTRQASVCFLGATATRPIGTPCATFANLPAGFDAKVHSTSVAGFTDLTYAVTDRLSAIGGVRLNYETLDYSFSVFNTAAALRPVTVRFADAKSVDDTVALGRAGFKYAFARDTNLFFVYSRGYKGYAFDLTTSFTPTIATQQPILPETSNSYEVNLKTQMLGRRLSVNTALFLTDYDNFQVQAFDTTAAAFRLLNAGAVRTEGVEVDATYKPIEDLSFSAGLAYTHARVRDFPGGPCYAGETVVATAPGQGAPLTCANNGTAATGDDTQNLKGGRLPNSPDWRFTFNARYEHPLGALPLRGFVDGGVVTQSSTEFALNQNPGSVQPDYTTANLSVGVRDRDGRYELTLFARNLFDQNFASAIFEAPVNNSPTGNFGQYLSRYSARFVGANLRLNF